jgi:hypothetical protein
MDKIVLRETVRSSLGPITDSLLSRISIRELRLTRIRSDVAAHRAIASANRRQEYPFRFDTNPSHSTSTALIFSSTVIRSNRSTVSTIQFCSITTPLSSISYQLVPISKMSHGRSSDGGKNPERSWPARITAIFFK